MRGKPTPASPPPRLAWLASKGLGVECAGCGLLSFQALAASPKTSRESKDGGVTQAPLEFGCFGPLLGLEGKEGKSSCPWLHSRSLEEGLLA